MIDEWINLRDLNRGLPTGMTPTGVPITVSRALPSLPTFTEDIARTVRHGLKARCPAALRTLDVGPQPGDPIHAVRMAGAVVVSEDLYGSLQREARREVVARRGALP